MKYEVRVRKGRDTYMKFEGEKDDDERERTSENDWVLNPNFMGQNNICH